jgi:hypothetical protein
MPPEQYGLPVGEDEKGWTALSQSGVDATPIGGEMSGTTAGPPYHERTIVFRTEDGIDLNVINVRGPNKPTKGPVILAHGAGVRANMFRAPVATNIVDYLVQRGYDVWLENWRASIDVKPTNWTLDLAARFDHPMAVRTVMRETGADSLKAIVHCQGSTSFAMAACAGLLPDVETIISNAVSLHTIVPRWSHFKSRFLLPAMHGFLRGYNPAWGEHPPNAIGRAILAGVKLSHHECDQTVCKLVSFTYGTGRPALWRHQNLNRQTHEDFIPREFGFVPITFFDQISRCVSAGHLVSYRHMEGLPDDYLAQPPSTEARWVFLSGAHNKCVLPESQTRTYEWFDKQRPGFHGVHVFDDYSHLDIFMGQSASQDIFPVIERELEAS